MQDAAGLNVMDIDTLYPQVTEAIRQAEALEDRDDPRARAAFREVSRLEEDIASVIPPSDYEGAIARRGAVRAAIKSHHSDRALQLVARYEVESGVDAQLAADLRSLRDQAIAIATADQEQFVAIAVDAARSGGDDTKRDATVHFEWSRWIDLLVEVGLVAQCAAFLYRVAPTALSGLMAPGVADDIGIVSICVTGAALFVRMRLSDKSTSSPVDHRSGHSGGMK